MPREKKRKEEAKGGAGWLTTYGDMVTLLLTFFVFLFSFSTIDVMQFQKMIFSFKGALGVLTGGKTFDVERIIGMGFTGMDAGKLRQQTPYLKEVMKQVERLVQRENLGGEVKLRFTREGLVITLTESILFDPGSAALKPSALSVLLELSKILSDIPNDLRVEGHTDNTPISTPIYPSNWELSSARAASVAKFIIDRGKIDPRRVSIAGYGQYKPIVPNDTPEHKALNRRVDIVILSTKSLVPF
ncbi:MAG: flagellar motor protein MotB [Synergistetes bacterium]|nr:MAG: OmpA/MotB domain protein [bacterium 42_11]MBC7331010.1 flagellar motor protein MotB [Synergistota bacterium]MDK2871599.1 chemotaxis protein MotB [bacterium]